VFLKSKIKSVANKINLLELEERDTIVSLLLDFEFAINKIILYC